MPRDIQIAIPSYHRPRRIAEATLPLLLSGGVDMSTVTVFLTDDAELEAYRPSLDQFGVGVEVGHAPGLVAARTHIAEHYPPGTRLVQLDDDITRLVRRVDEKHLADVADVSALLHEGFDAAGDTLWCIYPVPNPFYMDDRVRRAGLWYAEGAFFAYVVKRADHELTHVDHGEDYERSIRFFEARGAVTRLDMYSFVSKFWEEPGGLSDIRTTENVEAGLSYITDRWPGLARRYVNAKGRPNLRLKAFR